MRYGRGVDTPDKGWHVAADEKTRIAKGSDLPDHMVRAGLASGVAFWLADALFDAWLTESSFLDELLRPSAHELWVRAFVVMAILAFTLYARDLLRRRRRAERQLAIERYRLNLLYDHSPDGVIGFGRDLRLMYANRRSEEVLRLPFGESMGKRCYEVLFGRTATCDGCPVRDVISKGEPRDRIKHDIHADGHETWVHQMWYPVTDSDGFVDSVVEIARDITELEEARAALERQHHELERAVDERTIELSKTNALLEMEVAERMYAEDQLRESEERYRQLVELSPDMIIIHCGGLVRFINAVGAQLLGAERPHEIVGRPMAEFIHPDWREAAMERMRVIGEERRKLPPGEMQFLRLDGSVVDVEVVGIPFWWEGKPAIQGVVRDITERKLAEATIKRMAYYDPLTDLPNRTLFNDRLKMALAQAHRNGEPVAVMFLDIDNFKAINDTLGHPVGDRLLISVADRLAEIIREGDTVARLGGDEFTLLLPQISHGRDAHLVADKVLEALRPPFMLDGLELHSTASIGIAMYPNDGEDPETLLKNADTAMYRAKERGRNNFQMYSPMMNAEALERLALENDLRHALERDEFVLYYQPQVDIESGDIVGTEALVRWRHPERGLVPPLAFIGIAEETGLIVPIGEWIVREACRQNQEWQSLCGRPMRVAVNLSARQFLRGSLTDTVRDALRDSGLDPELLELEITESIAMHNVEYLLEILRELRAMGVHIAIDDFGTGYSSLSYLQRFPIHTLKIAQNFVRDVGTDADSAAIAGTVLALGRSLALNVVAEGVETEAQLDFLRERECRIMQGYLFSRPIPAEELTQLLRSGERLAG